MICPKCGHDPVELKETARADRPGNTRFTIRCPKCRLFRFIARPQPSDPVLPDAPPVEPPPHDPAPQPAAEPKKNHMDNSAYWAWRNGTL